MGGLTKTLFGGSSSKSSQSSDNQAYGALAPALTPNIGTGNGAMSLLGSMLGIGDPSAAAGAYKNFLSGTGFQSMLDTGSKAITGNAASRGLLDSGATGKGLEAYGQNLGMQKVGDFMGQLTGLGNYGLQSAQTLASAGNKSTMTSTGSSQGGIVNSLFPKGLSDRRTKFNIVKVGEFDDGLGLYDYEYTFAPGKRFRGVMADEVAKLRPEAMGPKAGRYDTVNYKAILGLQDGPFLIKEAA
jgi:hypothetical protein